MEMKKIFEMIKRERVVRQGKWITKYKSDREGYKISNKGGVRKEIKMPYIEITKRKRSAKKAAIKRKGKMAGIIAKRNRSLSKR